MELCQVIGCPHPDDLERPPWSIDWRKFEDWLAWWNHNPWGQTRSDERAAVPWGILAAAFGSGEEPPSPIYPYYEPGGRSAAIDVDASFAAMQKHLAQYGYLDEDPDGQSNQQPVDSGGS